MVICPKAVNGTCYYYGKNDFGNDCYHSVPHEHSVKAGCNRDIRRYAHCTKSCVDDFIYQVKDAISNEHKP